MPKIVRVNVNWSGLSRLNQSLALVFLVALMFVGTISAQTNAIMQGFYWNTIPGDTSSSEGVWYDSIAAVGDDLAAAGFATVWVPPATKGFAGVYDMGYGMYDYYDFGNFDQQGTIRTRHGTRSQLEAMIDTLHNAGLLVMADLVLNHRGGASGQQLEDCDDGGGIELRFTDFQPASGRLPMDSTAFHPNAFPGHCDLNAPYHDRIFFEDVCYFNFLDSVLIPGPPDAGWYFGPHNLGAVGDSLVVLARYMQDELGFDELRLDAIKHIEPGFMAPFLVEINDGAQPFVVGELFDGNLGVLKSYHDEVEAFNSSFGTGSKDASIAMMDFNLRFALRDMANDVAGGFNMWALNTTGLRLNPGGGLDGEDIVTFIENHDFDRVGWEIADCNDPDVSLQIGATCLKLTIAGGHDPVFTDKHMPYAYLMAAEGRPLVFWKDWFWYGLADEIRWVMALRGATGTGSTTPVSSLNPFSPQGLVGDDLFAMQRSGLMFLLNDNPSSQLSYWLDSPAGWAGCQVKDYSDAFMFQTSEVFGDTRALYKCDPRNYSWYAPTGLYPQVPGSKMSHFTLGSHQGAQLQYVVLLASDVADFLVNGAPLQAGDELAIVPAGGGSAVGIGRVGQEVQWDGVHDMLIEVLGGSTADNAKGGLLNGNAYDLVIFDASEDTSYVADSVTLSAIGSGFQFSAKRPFSRGGSTPFPLSETHDVQTFLSGAISRISGFSAGEIATKIYVDSAVITSGSGRSWTTAFKEVREALAFATLNPSVDTICVAQGTYLPTADGDRARSFVLTDSITILGGFPSGGADLDMRDAGTNLTRLSGNIGMTDSISDNTLHVVTVDSLVGGITMDGFIIQDGFADGGGVDSRGSGLLIFGDVVMRDVLVQRCAGSLPGSIVYCSGMAASLTLDGCSVNSTPGAHPIVVLNDAQADIQFLGNTSIED